MPEDTKPVHLTVGLQTTVDPSALKDGEYTFALNALLVHQHGRSPYIGNIASSKLQDFLPDGYIFLGGCELDDNSYVVMLGSFSGDCEIGYFKDGKYKTKVNYAKLGFRVDKQITVRYKISYTGDRIIYWTDDNTSPSWMNFDNPNFIKVIGPDGCTLVPTADLDLDTMKIFKDYDVPCITIEDTPETGNLSSAMYFITGQYADALSNGLTAWFHLVGGVPIFRDSLSQPFEYIGGQVSEEPTGKAIRIKIAGADISFTHINIGVVKVTNGVKSAFRVATLPITTTSFIYTGVGNTEIIVPLDEIIQPAVNYDTARTLDVTSSELLLGDLKGFKEFNFQPYISKIQVQWQVYKAFSDDKEHSFKNPVFAAYMKTFRQDEVYALGLQLDFTDGTTSKGYHVPARKLNLKSNGLPFTITKDQFGNAISPAEWDDAPGYQGNDVYDIARTKRWQIYNTATLEGDLDQGGAFGLGKYGEMSYWESERTYPCDKNIWGDDAGKPIRHHKFPDSTMMHIHDGENAARGYEEKVKINYLGITLPNINQVILSLPAEVRARIKGWRVVVGDRTYSKSVIASGITLNARKQNWKYKSDDKDDFRLYPNYPLNDLRADPFILDANFDIARQGISGFLLGLIGIANTDLNDPGGSFQNTYLKDTFFFHSPDTHFKKTFLAGTEMKLNVELYGKTKSYHEFVEPYPDFKEKGDDNDRAALQATSIGWYNNYSPVKQNNTRRHLKESQYIPFNSRVSGGAAGFPIWNTFRESSVLLGTDKIFDNPTHRDTSRFCLETEPDRLLPGDQQFSCDKDKTVNRDASLYYASIKRYVPDQYGDIYEIRYVDTYRCRPASLGLPDNVVFGGDTFIGQMTLKTQQVFYQNAQQFMLADNGLAGADFKPAETIAHTKYYYRNRGTGGNPRNQSAMMCEDNQGTGIFGLFGDGNATALGYIDLMMYGIPCFWAESDFNIELRNDGKTAEETFYRYLGRGAYKLTDLLGIKTIDKDNFYYCNEDYSAKNYFKLIEPISADYDPLKTDVNDYSTRVLYSLKSQPEDIYDNWLRFKPLNYYDLPKTRGRLVSINYLGNYTTMFRMQRGIFIDTLYNNLEASNNQIILGSGKLFDKEPNEIAFTGNGYGGSEAQWALDVTEYGTMFPSSRDGNVFLFAGGRLESITEGMEQFFNDNMAFKLPDYLKDISEDNAANPEGIGFLCSYDPYTGHWFLTKRDYDLVDAKNGPKLSFKDGRVLLDEAIVSLANKELFIDKSWTYAFHPPSKRWISMQSFLPHAYISLKSEMHAIYNEPKPSVHKHNDPDSFSTFNGKKFPYIVELVQKEDVINSYVNPNISYISSAFSADDRSELDTFNKAILYNLHQCSGLLPLIVQDENDLSTLFTQLGSTNESRDVAIRYREGHWNFSDFFDIFKHDKSVPHFFTDKWANAGYRAQFPIDKVLNHSTLAYDTPYDEQALMRQRWIKIRFILDNRNDLKLLLHFVSVLNRPSAS